MPPTPPSSAVPSFWTLIQAHSATRPGATAVTRNDTCLTWQDLRDATRQIRHGLRNSAVAPGETALVMANSTEAFFGGVAACQAEGVIPVLCSGKEEPEEQRFLQADSRAKVCICSHSAAFNSPQGLTEIAVHEGGAGSTLPDLPDDVTPAPDDCCAVVYTSGTTSGTRKGVLITFGNMSTTARHMNAMMGTDESTVEVVFAPLYHAFALCRCFAIWACGGSLRLEDGPYTPLRLLPALAQEEVTAFSTVSATMGMLLRYCAASIPAISGSIRHIQVGAGPLTPEQRDALLDAFPAASICYHYGLTEAMRATFIDLAQDREHRYTEGRASAEVEIRIADTHGDSLPVGEVGEILIRGANLAKGYLHDTAAWSDRLQEGWFRTHDLGSLDTKGYLTFKGRVDFLLNVGGFLVHPDEIACHLTLPPDTVRFCILGMADPKGLRGDVPVLVVEADEAPSIATVCKDFPKNKAHLIPAASIAIDPFPQTETGKIRRAELSRMVAEKLVSEG